MFRLCPMRTGKMTEDDYQQSRVSGQVNAMIINARPAWLQPRLTTSPFSKDEQTDCEAVIPKLKRE
jgi:hypothetical protein